MLQNRRGIVAATLACAGQLDHATKKPELQYSKPASAPAAQVVPSLRNQSIMPARAIASWTSFAAPIAHQVGASSITAPLGVRVGIVGALSSGTPGPPKVDHQGRSPDHSR